MMMSHTMHTASLMSDHDPFNRFASSVAFGSCGLEMPGRCFVSGQKSRENFTGYETDDGLLRA